MTLKKLELIEVGRPAEKTAIILTAIIKEIYYGKTDENMRPRFNYK
jgi:hypothetical protein